MSHCRNLTLIAGLLCGALFSVDSLAVFAPRAVNEPHSAFPAPAAILPQVDFWTRVYVEVDTGSGYVHDNRLMSVVYETLRVSDHRRARERHVKARKRHWRRVLEKLSRGVPATTGDARLAVSQLQQALSRAPGAADFEAASKRLRFQRGQRDMFQAGLVRSGSYEARIGKILAAHGLPGDLAYLPHVESSFNTYAYSKTGAAGMWQFMRSTGRRYLRIDGVVDERLEPIKATYAAAKLLRTNHRLLGTWPLAITAYNHGAHGMRRARAAVGTTDIATIIENYDGRSFGFASRNFYAQFLAARRVARDYHRHFGPLKLAEPPSVHIVPLSFYADSRDLLKHLGVSRKEFAALNPSLRDAVFRSEKYVPSGFQLRLPAELSATSPELLLARIPAQRRFESQRVARVHRVRPGETLGQIARRYRTSVSKLMTVNGLKNRHRIYAGQKLELLGD